MISYSTVPCPVKSLLPMTSVTLLFARSEFLHFRTVRTPYWSVRSESFISHTFPLSSSSTICQTAFLLKFDGIPQICNRISLGYSVSYNIRHRTRLSIKSPTYLLSFDFRPLARPLFTWLVYPYVTGVHSRPDLFVVVTTTGGQSHGVHPYFPLS